MEWISVIILIVFGLALLLVEIIFIPGTTFVGITGSLSMLVGLWLSFDYFGENVGWIVTVATSILTATSLYFGFKSTAWQKFSLQKTNNAKVNEGLFDSLKEGDLGTSLSTLRPIGKVEFGGQILEARTWGDYLEAGVAVRIVKIESDRIIVEPN